MTNRGGAWDVERHTVFLDYVLRRRRGDLLTEIEEGMAAQPETVEQAAYRNALEQVTEGREDAVARAREDEKG
jgi:hypothetical protein